MRIMIIVLLALLVAPAGAQDMMRNVDLSSPDMTSAEMTRAEVERVLAAAAPLAWLAP